MPDRYRGTRLVPCWARPWNALDPVCALSFRVILWHLKLYHCSNAYSGVAGMTFDEVLTQVLGLLKRQGRVSYGALKRRFDLDQPTRDSYTHAASLACA